MLPDLGFKHRLHYGGRLGYLGDLVLQLCAKRNGTRLSAKKYKPEQGRKVYETHPRPSALASGLDLRGLGFLLPTLGLDPRRLG